MKTLSFDSDVFGATHAFEAYHDLYSGGTDVARAGARFKASVVGYRFPRMLMFDRTLCGVSHQRTLKRVSRDSFDHIMLQAVVAGTLWIDTDDTPRAVQAGEMVVFDLTKPQRTWADQTRIITMSIAREILDRNLARRQDLHGRIIPSEKAAFLFDHLTALARHAETLSVEVAATITSTVGVLLAATIESCVGAPASPLHHAQKVDRALRFIDDNLKDPALSIATILRETGMSRSVLYRMFEPLGGVATCIQQRRLIGVKRALAQPRDTRSINAIMEAHGFTSASTGNRAFRDVYGQPPGAFRAALETSRGSGLPRAPETAGLMDSGNSAKGVLNKWHIELL